MKNAGGKYGYVILQSCFKNKSLEGTLGRNAPNLPVYVLVFIGNFLHFFLF